MKRSREILSFLLSLALVLALFDAGSNAARATTIYVPDYVDGDGEGTGAYDYTDVSEDDDYYDAVLWALVNDITNGTSATTFSPEEGCTRAQVMTFLHRAAGEPEPKSTTSPFTDVRPGSWYYKAVLWAVEQGITNGTGPATFSPDAPCTEEQILTFLWRAKGEPAAAQDYKGSTGSSWSSGATAWAQSTGMVSSSNTSTLSTTVCTRGNTVYYMYESTVSYTDGTGTFENRTQVSLNGGVYTASSTASFVSATMTLVNDYSGRVKTAGADSSFSSGRLVVSSRSPLPDLTAYHAAQVVTDTNGCSVIQFTSAADASACADYLESLSYVNYAEPDILIQKAAYGSGNTICWGSDATGCAAYAANLVSRGVNTDIVVAVVDTGTDTSHPFLQGRTVAGYDFVGGDSIPDDKDGHGTHVAGTIVDCTPGTNVKIMPVCVMGSNGGYTTTIAQGIRYAADHGASVINLSLGGGHSSYMDSAVSYALSKGVTVVAAAGNESSNAANFCPAHISGAITVSAVDSSYQLAYFSNYGSVVDLAAPGMNITSCIPGGGYASWQGTSMASPHVAAAAALLLCGQSRSLLPATVEKRLKAAAYDLGNSNYYGAGFLDMTSFMNGNVPDEGDDPAPAPEPTPAPSPTFYTITFDPQGGTVSPSVMTVTAGSSFGYLPTPTRSGYTFSGWYSARGQYVRYFDIPGGDLTLYAYWTANTPTPTPEPTPAPTPTPAPSPTVYTITFDPQGGTVSPSVMTVTAGSSFGYLPTPTRSGCTFSGWYTSSGQYVRYYDIPGGDLTLYAYWTANTPTPTPDPTPTPSPTPSPSPGGSACGPSLTWSYSGGVLTISGTGEMYDYSSGAQTPWAAYRGEIRVIRLPSVVSIGSHAFEGCAVTSLSFTGIVNRIGSGAFRNCTALSMVSVTGIVNSIESYAFDGCTSLSSVSVSGIVNSVDPTAFPGGVWR